MNTLTIKDTNGAILAVIHIPLGEVIVRERNGVAVLVNA